MRQCRIFAMWLALLPVPSYAAVRVELTGLDGELERNARLALSIREAADDEDDLAETRMRVLHARAADEISGALEPFGFYRSQVHAELVREGDDWVAQYDVAPGPPILVGEVDVVVSGEGSDDPGFRRVVAGFPLASGDRLVHGLWEAGKASLEEQAVASGYLDAKVLQQQVVVDLARYVADVHLQLDTGPPFRFGDVRFVQSVVDDDIVRGYVTFDRGEPFDFDELADMQDALSDSSYFSRVEVVPLRDQAVGNEVPIEVQLVPSKEQRWNAGLGYGTDSGPRATLGLELRRINKRGHRAESELVYSEVQESAAARYMVPGPYPRTDVVTYSVGYARFAPETSESNTALVGASLARSRGRWRETFALNYEVEEFEVGLDSGKSELLMPAASWSRVESDDRLYPKRGIRVEVGLRAADDSVLSNASFVQLRGEAKQIVSFADDRFRLLARVRVGSTETSELADLPPTVRFFAGGDQSVRGYGFRELGPLDAAGNVVGGERLVEGSVEIDSLFFEKFGRWGAAVFYDAGNAVHSFSDDLVAGAGVGIRWLSPVGLVRADAAWALDEPGTPISFHLAIGPDL